MKYNLIVFAICLFCLLCLLWYNRSTQYDPCRVFQRIETENGTIEIVDERCQEGLPHTSDANTIRMTQARYNSPNLDTLLTHERIHLEQKRNPDRWRSFYKHVWGYDLLNQAPPSIPSSYTRRVRPNPDTADSPWAVWNNRYVFFPVFGEQGTLRSATVCIWDLKEQTEVGIPEAWKSYFCDGERCPHQYEHPHELSAEYKASKFPSQASNDFFQYTM